MANNRLTPNDVWGRWIAAKRAGEGTITLTLDEARQVEHALNVMESASWPKRSIPPADATPAERAAVLLQTAAWFLTNSRTGEVDNHWGAAAHALTCATMAVRDLTEAAHRTPTSGTSFDPTVSAPDGQA